MFSLTLDIFYFAKIDSLYQLVSPRNAAIVLKQGSKSWGMKLVIEMWLLTIGEELKIVLHSSDAL